MEAAGSMGLSKIAEQGLSFAILVIIIVGLCWFIRYLLNELKESRVATTDTLTRVTDVMARLEETVKTAVNR
jgi:hypothetical protein